MNKHRMNANIHHNEETLKCEGKLSLEIVLSHVPFLDLHGGNGDCSERGHKVDFKHSTVDDNEDAVSFYCN